MKKRTNIRSESRKPVDKSGVSPDVIRRLNIYLRDLKRLHLNGTDVISSAEIAKNLGITPVQFRKDLSCFGEFGTRGVGYQVSSLISSLQEILSTDSETRIALVGAGKLGGALLEYSGFSEFSLRISEVFDMDPEKIGKKISGRVIRNVKCFSEITSAEGLKTGIICVPASSAQSVCNLMVSSGITGILNFAPAKLKTGKDIFVANVDMAVELKSLSYFQK